MTNHKNPAIFLASMKNLEVVKILNTIADILELQEVPFKPQAYRRAALSIESLSEDIREVYRRDELEEIPGVGKAIAEKITELLETGKLSYYEKLKKEIDLDIEELLSVPQLGPRKIKVLYKKLGIKNIKLWCRNAMLFHKFPGPGFIPFNFPGSFCWPHCFNPFFIQ